MIVRYTLMVAGIWACTYVSAQAGWGVFYTKSLPLIAKKIELASPVQSICVREILLAQTRYNIPDNILLGIGLQEAGTKIDKQLFVWPWAINVEGQGYLLSTKASAIARVGQQLNNGVRSIDVGCMQVNLRWHPNAFSDLTDAFNPKINVDYAARLLKQHYKETGNWRIAAGRYHSKTPEKQKVYLKSLSQNIYVANAQIDRFRALANLKSPVTKATKQPQIQPVERVVELSRKQSFWTAAISVQGKSANRYRSIYSQAQLQPILPKFSHDALRRFK